MVDYSFENYDRVYAGFSDAYTCLDTLRMGFKPHIYDHLDRMYVLHVFNGPHNYLREVIRGDMRNKCPNIRVLQGLI